MRLPNRAYVDRTLTKAYTQHDNEIHLIPYTPRAKNQYGETLGKTYGTPKIFKAYLETDPTELKLQDLGWSKETVEILIRVPFITLLELKLANPDGTVTFTTDDKIDIPHIKREYQLYKFQLREPFINGQPTFVWIAGRKYVNGR